MANKKAETEILEVEMRTLDLEGEGFWPKWKKVIATKEAFMNPMEATMKDLEEAEQMLIEYMVKPAKLADKMKVINQADAETLIGMINMISGEGQNAVPPSNGGDSEDTSE